MDSEAVEKAYEACMAAHRRVAKVQAEYQEAVRQRVDCLKVLRGECDQSYYRIGKRLGITPSRVAQIIRD